MNDPHVVALRYRLETDPSLTYDSPSPIEHNTEACTLRLADGMIACTMKAHYASAEEARAVVDPVLRAWELDTALREGKRALWFVYEDAEVVDRNPSPVGSGLRLVATGGTLRMTGGVTSFLVTRRKYPAPPQRFKMSPDVETLWHRYEGYQQGREPLLAMAYFCLSFLDWRGSQHPGPSPNRRRAASLYAIEYEVLKQLGNLTTNLGDEKTTRKIDKESLHREPTPGEVAWIEAAIKMIIRRVGEHAADSAACRPLSMCDLPPLTLWRQGLDTRRGHDQGHL